MDKNLGGKNGEKKLVVRETIKSYELTLDFYSTYDQGTNTITALYFALYGKFLFNHFLTSHYKTYIALVLDHLA
jgi:hypothetical protein